MKAKYIKKEIADLNGTGHTQAVYKMKVIPMNYEWFVKVCEKEQRIPKALIKSVVTLIEDGLSLYLAEGYSVKLGNIGTFTAKLGVSDDVLPDAFEPGKSGHNARNIQVTGASFRVSPDFVKRMNENCHLESAGESRIRRPQTTLDERVQLARKYLEQHPMMRIKDYVWLTGLSRTTASLELRRIVQDPESGITSIGARSQKYYTLKKQP